MLTGFIHAYIERKPYGLLLMSCEEDTVPELMSFEDACEEVDHCTNRCCKVYEVREAQL